jgi:hypothetical protein
MSVLPLQQHSRHDSLSKPQEPVLFTHPLPIQVFALEGQINTLVLAEVAKSDEQRLRLLFPNTRPTIREVISPTQIKLFIAKNVVIVGGRDAEGKCRLEGIVNGFY